MFFGFDPVLRGALEAPPATLNKEGVWQCKKHGGTRESPPLPHLYLLSSVSYSGTLADPHLVAQSAPSATGGRSRSRARARPPRRASSR